MVLSAIDSPLNPRNCGDSPKNKWHDSRLVVSQQRTPAQMAKVLEGKCLILAPSCKKTSGTKCPTYICSVCLSKFGMDFQAEKIIMICKNIVFFTIIKRLS